ncbi:MAG: rod shape-determining protein MreD [Parvibaculum sp.]|jgi:rod shape-determining protein MreD|uniref:rod shape-determining protein MreD n=1 Tax=Parvibaculum sp. TaxID=2024848 RepID=UPI002844B634|nr:rod shape-determining protein MreD [Parvibaculum sp.]MDR3500478.1 rod shape-determining protein MreD [Parvibaculum sp.]
MARLDPYTPTPAGRAGRVVMTLLPFVMGILCVFFSFVPVGRIFGTSVMPAFALMAIYYWAIVRPEMFPVYAVFLVGLLSDLLSGGPIGLWAFVYVLTYAVVLSQRFLIVSGAFSVFWLGFLLAAAFAGVASWTVASISYGQVLAARPIVLHMLVTVIVFPVFSWLFGRIERRILPSG